jgi:glutathione S-transferase
MVASMSTWLVAVPASHPCAAVESALRLKRVPYRRVDLVPVFNRPLQRLLFGAPTVPAVRFDDGVRVVGSRAIMRALESRVSEPVLLGGPEVDAAEAWGEEVLQPLARRLTWASLRRAPAALPTYTTMARPPIPAPITRIAAPLVIRAAVAFHGAGPVAAAADLDALDGHLDRVDGWIADGTLGGEMPNAADLQVASSLRLLLTVEALAQRIDPRPAGALARRLFPSFPGSLPA